VPGLCDDVNESECCILCPENDDCNGSGREECNYEEAAERPQCDFYDFVKPYLWRI
jgi:hypothetical protein